MLALIIVIKITVSGQTVLLYAKENSKLANKTILLLYLSFVCYRVTCNLWNLFVAVDFVERVLIEKLVCLREWSLKGNFLFIGELRFNVWRQVIYVYIKNLLIIPRCEEKERFRFD